MSGIVKYYNELIGGFEGTGGNADTHTKGSGADVQIFTTTGSGRTWVKPSWATTVYIEAIGAGGGGGGGAQETSSLADSGGGGGGAAAHHRSSGLTQHVEGRRCGECGLPYHFTQE